MPRPSILDSGLWARGPASQFAVVLSCHRRGFLCCFSKGDGFLPVRDVPMVAVLLLSHATIVPLVLLPLAFLEVVRHLPPPGMYAYRWHVPAGPFVGVFLYQPSSWRAYDAKLQYVCCERGRGFGPERVFCLQQQQYATERDAI